MQYRTTPVPGGGSLRKYAHRAERDREKEREKERERKRERTLNE
jgi:hypothetical protein